MKLIIPILAILAVLAGDVRADKPEIYPALYAIQNKRITYPMVAPLFRGVEKRGFSFLWGTFGHSNAVIKRIMSKSVGGHVHLYAHNATCNPPYCYNGELAPHLSQSEFLRLASSEGTTLNRRLVQRLGRIRQLSDLLVSWGVTVTVVMGLEARWPHKGAQAMRKIFERELPGYEIVYNSAPYANRRPHNGFKRIELHEPERCGNSACIYSNDGFDIQFLPSHTRHSNQLTPGHLQAILHKNIQSGSSLQFVWWGKIQGRYGNSSFPPKPKRRFYGLAPNEIHVVRHLCMFD